MSYIQLGSDISGNISGGRLGASVSVNSDGTIVAMGSTDANSGNGLVKIYQNINSVWSQIGSDISGNNPVGRLGWSVSVNSDGNIVAMSAPGANSDQGLVKIYQNVNSVWTQIGSDISGNITGNLGYSVSINSSGSIVAMSAPGFNSGNGLVKIYQNVNSAWTQIGSDISGNDASGNLGYSVSINSDGTIVAMGAPFANSSNGLVKIYKNVNSVWTQIGSNISGTGNLGFSVSINSNGTIVAIGAQSANSSNGLVKIYKNVNSVWTQIGSNISGNNPGGRLGYSVSIDTSGSIVAMGVANANSNNGLVKIYQNVNSVWSQIGSDILGNGGRFGFSVSVNSDGNIVAMGAPGFNSTRGLVKVYANPPITPTIGDLIIPSPMNIGETFQITNPTSNSSGAFSYTSSNTSVETVSGNLLTAVGTGRTTITATQASTNIFSSGSVFALSETCFPAGTLIDCNQGFIPIEQINPDIHTIRGKKIVTITQTILPNKYLVCFEKGSLENNTPSQKTIISKNHKILYNGKMRNASQFVGKFENVTKIKYTGEVLYNVLMEKHDKMMVNNLICETLHPQHDMAKLYKIMKDMSPSNKVNFIKEYNIKYTSKNKKSILTV
jgi:hypothetical protein